MLAPAWEAFWFLSASRPVHQFGIGALSMADIRAYCDEEGWVGEWRAEVIQALRLLDGLYVSDVNKKSA